jgi:outer membrane protein OmpA-like peptidoglycan-associated protein
MKLSFGKMVWSVVLAAAAVSSAQAGFQNAAEGVRPAGMGGAFVAVADDANAGLHNPAGYAQVSRLEVTGMYADLYSQLNAKLYTGETDRLGYNLLGLALPPLGSLGNLGIIWNQLYSTLYQENTYTFSFARPLLAGNRLSAGISAKLLQWSVAANDVTADPANFPERSKSGLTLDLGLLSALRPDLTVGLSAENLLPVDLGLNTPDPVPPAVHLGAAYTAPWRAGALESVLLAAEVSDRRDVIDAGFGVETQWWSRFLALRAGINFETVNLGLGVHYGWPGSPVILQVDYAFAYPFQVGETLGSHRVGLTLAWNEPPAPAAAPPAPDESEALRLQAKIKELESQKQSLENQLSQFKREIEIGTLNAILFETGKNALLPSAFPTLDYLGKILAQYPELVVKIEGHTDDVGNDAYNLTLSQKRAESVSAYLTEKYPGIRPDHLIAIGYGKTKPLSNELGDAARARNRRVEFIVINPYVK